MPRGAANLSEEFNPAAAPVDGISCAKAGFLAGLCRARSWRAPPNWTPADWHEELHALAATAAWQAERDFNPLRGVPMECFVCSRVKTSALARYRQEWRYALRTAIADNQHLQRLSGFNPAANALGVAHEFLDHALSQLPQCERWLLEQLFWLHRTEVAIAAELQISQPAVNKRKRVALLHLRSIL